MHDCKPIDTLVERNWNLSVDMCPKSPKREKKMSKVPYSSAIKILMYAMMSTCLDICYVVGLASRFQSNTGVDWGGNPNQRKSTSRYVFLLNDCAISWGRKKQPCIALSTMEPEYVTCSSAIQEVVWLRRFL